MTVSSVCTYRLDTCLLQILAYNRHSQNADLTPVLLGATPAPDPNSSGQGALYFIGKFDLIV